MKNTCDLTQDKEQNLKNFFDYLSDAAKQTQSDIPTEFITFIERAISYYVWVTSIKFIFSNHMFFLILHTNKGKTSLSIDQYTKRTTVTDVKYYDEFNFVVTEKLIDLLKNS